ADAARAGIAWTFGAINEEVGRPVLGVFSAIAAGLIGGAAGAGPAMGAAAMGGGGGGGVGGRGGGLRRGGVGGGGVPGAGGGGVADRVRGAGVPAGVPAARGAGAPGAGAGGGGAWGGAHRLCGCGGQGGRTADGAAAGRRRDDADRWAGVSCLAATGCGAGV